MTSAREEAGTVVAPRRTEAEQLEFTRAQRRRFVKWWFELIERILMVVTLGVAAKVADNWLIRLPYLMSMTLLAWWAQDSVRTVFNTDFPAETRAARLQQFRMAFGLMLRTVVFVTAIGGIWLFVVMVSGMLVGVTKPGQ